MHTGSAFLKLTEDISALLLPFAENEQEKRDLNFMKKKKLIEKVVQQQVVQVQPQINGQMDFDMYTRYVFEIGEQENQLLK